jgi:hypothetical protein
VVLSVGEATVSSIPVPFFLNAEMPGLGLKCERVQNDVSPVELEDEGVGELLLAVDASPSLLTDPYNLEA